MSEQAGRNPKIPQLINTRRAAEILGRFEVSRPASGSPHF